MKYKIILLATIGFFSVTPFSGFCQLEKKQEALIKTVRSFFKVYNTGDAQHYRAYLKDRIPAEILEDKWQRFNNTWKSIGPVKVMEIRTFGTTRAEGIVKEKRYGAWWRFTIETDSNQKFVNRTVLPMQMPDIGLKAGQLKASEISNEITDYVEQRLKSEFAGNVYLSRRGQQFYNKSFGSSPEGRSNEPGTKFGLASAAKMFTAISILQLIEKGKFGMNSMVSEVLPELKNKIFQNIMIEQLLTHTSGLGDFFEDPSSQADVKDLENRETALRFLEKSALLFTPGTEFKYSNTGFLLLGLIIERVGERSFKSFVKENIFNPAGMQETIAGSGAGGGESTTGDIVKFFDALQSNKFMGAATTNKFINFHNKYNYGYGSEHHILGGEHVVGHSGGYINQCIELNLYCKTGFLVIILSNSNPPAGHFLSNKIKELLIRKF